MDKQTWLMGNWRHLVVLLAIAAVSFGACENSYGGEGPTGPEPQARDAAGDDSQPYHAPLAGERYRAVFMGRPIVIPAQDRGSLTSITLGGSVLAPSQGSRDGLPVAALYLRRVWEDARTRDVVAVFVNELEYDKSYGQLELVNQFDNYTLPGGQTELMHSREVKSTAVTWGTLFGGIGPGLRLPVSPFQVDNAFRLQVLGRFGYLYAERTGDSGADLVVPPSTLVYGLRLRGRYDGLRRNLLELPHQGVAAGWDVDYLVRNNWRYLGPGSGAVHRDYLQASGYLVAAGGVPGLSERDRVLFSFYGGKTGEGSADRFNAFRNNGGPFPSEADDLARPHYTGILYDDVRAAEYATGSLGYRRELAFFLYLSVVGTYLWADRATVQGADQVVFRQSRGGGTTVSLDSAFFWNSEIYLAYVWESGVIRDGKPGNGMIVQWSKSF